MYDSGELVRSAFRAGASGYLLKSDAEHELLHALRVVLEEGTYVSPRIDGELVKEVFKESR